MAHYRYCVYALHVSSISYPVLSKAFLDEVNVLY